MEYFFQKIPIPEQSRLARLAADCPPACWLDSALLSHPRARYSVLAAQPLAVLSIDSAAGGILQTASKSVSLERPMDFLDDWLKRHRFSSSLKMFPGGALGFMTYEATTALPAGGHEARPYGDLPAGYFLLVDTALVMDHRAGEAWVFSLGITEDFETRKPGLAELRGMELLEALEKSSPQPPREVRVASITSNTDQQQYLRKIEIIKEALLRGDCYQVNLSQRFTAEGDWDPGELYLRLRSCSTAPQMAFLNLGDKQILSASPETLLEIEGPVARSFPIKGTRARQEDPSADRRQRESLMASAKDDAELLMIIDLVRNDLGRFCETGSIQVPALKSVESFPHVHHLVGCVQGKLRSDVTPLQALLQMSPGGSITGAPKRKAMEIIAQLEETSRGIYTGSIGYLGLDGQAAFNIAIRTAFLQGRRLEYSAGGGVVADSDPEAEYEESLQKAKGFFMALGIEYP